MTNFSTILSFALLINIVIPYASSGAEILPCHNASSLIRTIYRHHISPPKFGEEEEAAVVSRVVNLLDGHHYIFYQEDIEGFLENSRGVLDSNQNTACKVAEAISTTYYLRKQATDSMLYEILNAPLELVQRGQLHLNHKPSTGFPSGQPGQYERLQKWVTYTFLSNYYRNHAIIDSTGKETTSYKDFDEKIRGSFKSNLDCNGILNKDSIQSIVSGYLLEEIAKSFDPHSTYFSPSGKQEFQAALSAEALSFGMYMEKDEQGVLTISDIVPGGAAWKSRAVFEGDVIERITTPSGAELNLSCMTADEIIYTINNGREASLSFHISRNMARVSPVTLEKGLVDVDENVIRGFVLEGASKVGYIALPSFYTDWEHDVGLGCANDVAREILSLMDEGIEGLILDLRFNGGGSVREALQLAGIFINEGTLLVTSYKNDKPRLLKDPNRGTVYNGPLLVLVNGMSASASEVVAAVLQDYNRALIVGDHTFGKATMQNIVPLLANNGKTYTDGSLGYVKVTSGALYRITGETCQQNGVFPDIILHGQYTGLFEKEKEYPKSLKLERIYKNTYAMPLAPLPVNELSAKSSARMDKKPVFDEPLALSVKFAAMLDMDSIALSPENISLYHRNITEVEEALAASFYSDDSLYSCQQHTLHAQLSQISFFEERIVSGLKNDLASDIYVQECYQIMVDWLMFAED